MIDEHGFGKRLDEAMIKAGYSNSKLTKELNVSKNAVGNYKNNQIPNAAILYSISQILGVTMEYLLTGNFSEELTKEEQELVDAYRRAGDNERRAILTSAKILAPESGGSSTSRTG